MLFLNSLILRFLLMQKLLNKFYFLGIIFLITNQLNAQNKTVNLQYILASDVDSAQISPVKIPQKGIQKYNPLFWFLNGSLTVYQKVISPQFSAICLYEQSCSRFSRASIQEYGLLKGVALTADRLSRCNRISATSINPFRITEAGKVIDSPKMYKNE
jgi:uncharacterized protein